MYLRQRRGLLNDKRRDEIRFLLFGVSFIIIVRCVAITVADNNMFTTTSLTVVIIALLSASIDAFVPAVHRSRHTRLAMSSADEITLNPAETAVVFIEYQNEFTTPGGKMHEAVQECMEKTNMLENSVKLATEARAAGCTVIHCPINFEPVRRS
jgi:predicted dienelactone hydrolase